MHSATSFPIDAAAIVSFHERRLRERDWPVMSRWPCPQLAAAPGIWQWIDANHRYNGLLWREEDRSHRLDVAPADIAAGQRLIVRYHQKRRDAVDAVDEALLALLVGAERRSGARLASETAGALIDRLSVLALQLHPLRAPPPPLPPPPPSIGPAQVASHVVELQGVELQGVAPPEAQIRAGRLAQLTARRQDLMACFDTLLAQTRAGTAYFKLYRQGVSAYAAPLNPYPSGQIRQPAAAYAFAAP
jgi:hypothetical protein